MRCPGNRLLSLLCAFLFLLLAILPTRGRAGMTYDYNFHRVTYNASVDLGAQLIVTVQQESDAQVSFLFKNNIGIPSSITDIYFYDGTYISGYPRPGDPTMIPSDGVSFSPPARPGSLPGYESESLGLVYSADADPWAKGINSSSESLELIFNLYQDRTFDSLLEGLESGDFVIGLHVQGIGKTNTFGGYGDSYVTPLPGSILLGVFAVGLAGRKLRQFV